MKEFFKNEDLVFQSKQDPRRWISENLKGFTFLSKVVTRYVGASCLFCAALLASSCQDDLPTNGDTDNGQQTLKVKVYNNAFDDNETKAIVTGTTFPANSEIGLTVAESAKTTYDGQTYNNLLYKLSSGSWSSSSKVYLSNTAGTVYAYYPYSSSVTDITAVPIEASGDKDYMYAKTTATVSNTNPTATLGMAHAMAAVTVKMTKGTYTGAGSVTGLTWQSTSAAKSAKLNAKTGALANITGANEAFDSGLTSTNKTTLAAQSQYLFLVVPAGTSGALSFTMNMDGQTYTAQSAAVQLKAGYKYNYTLQMNGAQMTVSSVTITDWVDNGTETINPSI